MPCLVRDQQCAYLPDNTTKQTLPFYFFCSNHRDTSIAQLSILSNDLDVLKLSPLSRRLKRRSIKQLDAATQRATVPSVEHPINSYFISLRSQEIQRSSSHSLLKEQSIEVGFWEANIFGLRDCLFIFCVQFE